MGRREWLMRSTEDGRGALVDTRPGIQFGWLCFVFLYTESYSLYVIFWLQLLANSHVLDLPCSLSRKRFSMRETRG